MPRKPQMRHWLARLGVLLTLLVAVALAGALYAANRRAAAMQARVAHTEQVLAAIGAIREQLALLESNQRGFLLTEDRAYVAARDEAIGTLRQTATSLTALVSDNPGQVELAGALQARIEDRVGLAQRTLDLYRDEGIESARSFFLSGAPERTTAEILALVRSLSDEENRLLRERREAEQRQVDLSRSLLAAAVAVGLLVLIPACLGFLSLSIARGRAEARLLDIAESLPGAIYELRRRPDGTLFFEFVSPRSEAVLGLPADTIRRRLSAVRERILPQDLAALEGLVERAAANATGFDADFRIRMPDGSVRWIHSAAVPTPARGDGILWTGYWSDISERKRDEALLREATQRLEDAQRMATMGDWSYDFDSGRVEWSRALFDLLDRDPALGALDYEGSLALFGSEGAETIRAAIARAVETGQTQRYELHFTHADGRVGTLDTIAVPVRDENDRIVALRGTMQDVTERRELADRLTEARNQADAANRAKSQFLATMSHEIRTPMYGILGMLELFGLTSLSREQRDSLQLVWDSGRSLQRIIDDILDFSKIEAGKLDLRAEPTSVARLIEGVRAVYSGAASRRGLALQQHVDPGISPALLVDGLRLRQILGNLVSNSLKFTERGHVALRAELLQRSERSDRIRFVVEDTGVGMSSELQSQAFAPFVQAEQYGEARGRGTGLGLAICARLAELMGGRIEIASEVGRGTRMTLDLDLTNVDPSELVPSSDERSDVPWSRLERVKRAAPPVEAAEAMGRLVLVVDDHPINRLVLQSQLETLGYAAEAVESAADAMALVRTRRIGLVITDCNMPQVSGYDLSRLIRAHERDNDLPRVPVIACTANALKGEFQKCFDAGMDDYLTKPTGLPRLLDKMNRWLPLGASTSEPERCAAPADPPLDLETLRILTGGREEATGRVLERFKRVNDRDVATLLSAFEREDSAEIARSAHRIKGASRLIGASALADVCETIETLAGEGDTATLGDHLARLQQQVEALDDFFRTHTV